MCLLSVINTCKECSGGTENPEEKKIAVAFIKLGLGLCIVKDLMSSKPGAGY